MSVIDFTPHELSYLISVSDGYEDENGDWHEGSDEWSAPMKCHAVPAGQANVITYDDGSTATYSFTVGRLAPDCREFKVGERVRLNADGMVREFQVKGFHRWQLQSKIWV
jgi:hypothetical protein